jgi:thiamine-phosphate pyrophosphorylase
LIQLREKNLPSRHFFQQAERASRVAHQRNVRIIVNDRVDIALAIRAAGVHLGQEDLPSEEARRLLGDEAIIGVSTHNVEQAQRASRLPVNYLAIGPIFPTTSKSNPELVVGLEGLRMVRDAIGDFPLVAIGGITLEHAREVLQAGANAVAVMSALVSNPDEITRRTAAFLAELG